MKFNIIAIGKMKSSPELDIAKKYIKRCSIPINIIELETKKTLLENQIKKAEADLTLSKISNNDILIALDETGTTFSSEKFSEKIKTLTANGQNIYFVIGGAFGLDKSVKQRADIVISFGAMTFPHMLVRVMLCEQLYRVQTIMDNHPYHKI